MAAAEVEATRIIAEAEAKAASVEAPSPLAMHEVNDRVALVESEL